MKPVPVRVKRMGIQQQTAVPDKFSAGDSQGKFVVEENHNGELQIERESAVVPVCKRN
jgi:hypothetical protein